MDVDVLFGKLRPLGPWQLVQLTILLLCAIPNSFHLLSIVLIGYEPPFECVTPQHNDKQIGSRVWGTTSEILDNSSDLWRNGSDVWRNETRVDQCSVYNGTTNETTPCTEWTFHVKSDTSIVSELSQVCSDRYKIHLSQTVLIAGQAAGAWVFNALSDRYGRKSVVIVTEVGLVAVTFVTAFVYDMWLFIALRFLTGACQQGSVATVAVLSSELVQSKHRGLAGGAIYMGWSVFESTIPLVGYVFRHQSWRHLQMFASLCGIILIVLHICMLDESVRWLLARSSTERACAVITRIRLRNRASVSESEILSDLLGEENMNGHTETLTLQPNDFSKTHSEVNVDNGETLPPTMLLKDPTLRKTTLMICFSWVTTGFVYFGVTLMSGTLAGDRFLSFFLTTVVSIPSTVAFYIGIQIFGRKRTLYFGFLVIVFAFFVSALVTMTTDMPPELKTTMWVLGKFGSSLNFYCLFTYTPELFPTKLRSLGLGIESAGARIGGMVAPFTVYLLDIQPWLPSAIFGLTSLVACLSIIALPETMHTELPQDMAQLHAMWRHRPHNTDNTELDAMSNHQPHSTDNTELDAMKHQNPHEHNINNAII